MLPPLISCSYIRTTIAKSVSRKSCYISDIFRKGVSLKLIMDSVAFQIYSCGINVMGGTFSLTIRPITIISQKNRYKNVIEVRQAEQSFLLLFN